MALPVFGLPVAAAPLYSQTPVSDETGLAADLDFDANGNRFADDFVLGVGGTARSVVWRGFWGNAGTPTFPIGFDLTIYNDNAGLPGTVLSNTAVSFAGAGEIVDTGIDNQFFPLDVYEFEANLTPTALSAGTTYWFSVTTDTAADADDNWFWVSSFGNTLTASQPDAVGDGPWFADTTRGPLYFVIDDAFVPEPGSLALLSLGALTLLRRRR